MSRKRVKDMQKKDEYCITAGEFAKMCQTTRDTLRYYERQGILVPKKNPVNGYHYYSYAQISSYYFIKTFRELDCSVGDIKEYLLGGEEVRFDAFVDQQYDRLLMMRRELDRNEEDSGSDPDCRCRETGDQKSGTFFISDADRSPVVTGDFVRGDSRRYTQTSEML